MTELHSEQIDSFPNFEDSENNGPYKDCSFLKQFHFIVRSKMCFQFYSYDRLNLTTVLSHKLSSFQEDRHIAKCRLGCVHKFKVTNGEIRNLN